MSPWQPVQLASPRYLTSGRTLRNGVGKVSRGSGVGGSGVRSGPDRSGGPVWPVGRSDGTGGAPRKKTYQPATPAPPSTSATSPQARAGERVGVVGMVAGPGSSGNPPPVAASRARRPRAGADRLQPL